MSMGRKLFRPGAGQHYQEFRAYFAEEQIYPGDLCSLSVIAPALQGPAADGVLEGRTLGLSDFIYVQLLDTDDTPTSGLQVGVATGAGIEPLGGYADVINDSVAADNLIIVQHAGVHPMVQVNDTSVLIGDFITGGANAGEGSATATVATGDGEIVAMALAADVKYARAAAADQDGVVALVRCNF